MGHLIETLLILTVFIFIPITVSRGLKLSFSITIGVVALNILLGRNILEIFVAINHIIHIKVNLELIASVILIGWLGLIMKETGSLLRATSLLQDLLGNLQLTTAIISAFIGLLVVPGGAILSAPLVEELTKPMDYSPSKKAAINLTFRHITHAIIPFSSALIAVTSFAGASLLLQIVYNLPFTILIMIVAYKHYFHCPKTNTSKQAFDKAQLLKLVWELSPILVILLLFLLLQQPTISLCSGVFWAFIQQRASFREILASFKRGVNLDNILLIISILCLNGILRDLLQGQPFFIELFKTPYSALVVVIMFPLLIAFVTGSAVAGITLTTPFLATILAPLPNPNLFCGCIYFAALFGYLISPVHLCLALTINYFKVKITDLYREYWLPAGLVLTAAIVLGLLFIITLK